MEVNRNSVSEKAREEAADQVSKIRGFYYNLSLYLVIVPILMLLNYSFSSSVNWSFFPAIGWGTGVIIHAVQTFAIGSRWDPKKLKDIAKPQGLSAQDQMQVLRYERAVKKVKAVAGLYRHALIYLVINFVLLLIKYLSNTSIEIFFSSETFIMTFLWGAGLVMHAMGVYIPEWLFGADWEERKIRQIVNKGTRQKWE